MPNDPLGSYEHPCMVISSVQFYFYLIPFCWAVGKFQAQRRKWQADWPSHFGQGAWGCRCDELVTQQQLCFISQPPRRVPGGQLPLRQYQLITYVHVSTIRVPIVDSCIFALCLPILILFWTTNGNDLNLQVGQKKKDRECSNPRRRGLQKVVLGLLSSPQEDAFGQHCVPWEVS